MTNDISSVLTSRGFCCGLLDRRSQGIISVYTTRYTLSAVQYAEPTQNIQNMKHTARANESSKQDETENLSNMHEGRLRRYCKSLMKMRNRFYSPVPKCLQCHTSIHQLFACFMLLHFTSLCFPLMSVHTNESASKLNLFRRQSHTSSTPQSKHEAKSKPTSIWYIVCENFLRLFPISFDICFCYLSIIILSCECRLLHLICCSVSIFILFHSLDIDRA